MKKTNGASLALAFSFTLIACSTTTTATSTPPEVIAPPPPPRTAVNIVQDSRWVDETLGKLTLRQKVGQMLIPRISGAYMPAGSTEYQRLYDWVVRQGIGGVIITQGPMLELAQKLNTMQDLAQVPLLVTADMENGPGQILTTGTILPYGIDNGSATRFPPLMGIGASGDESFAYDLGRITALEGRANGVHMTYAPVVDVNNNADNPIINTRSFGEDPALVSRMARAHIRGVQENGMIATAKHFPGHGDTGTDSHINLPVISADRARANAVELPPYRVAIENNVGAIMSAHIAFPAMTGDSVPATLNPKLLTGLLRDELDYTGLIVTDAMDMGAIIKTFGNTNAAVMAVKAGADILLQPMPNDVGPMIDAVTRAVESGEISEERINQSVRRILQSKQRVGLDRQRNVDLAAISNVVSRAEHVQRAQEAADRSITAVRNRDNLLPLTTGRNIASIVYAADYDPFTGRTFHNTLALAIPGVRTVTLNATSDAVDIARAAAIADSADVVLFSPYVRVTAGKTGLGIPQPVAAMINATSKKKPTVIISFGSPYILSQFPDIGTYVLAWGQWDVSQRAAARALAGVIPITGRLPIAIPPFHRIGDGVDVNLR